MMNELDPDVLKVSFAYLSSDQNPGHLLYMGDSTTWRIIPVSK